MSEWIISCNPNNYNVDGAYLKHEFINWKQTVNVKVGDIVYIYIDSPFKYIHSKCLVTKSDLMNKDIDDTEFELDNTVYDSYGRYMELKFLRRYTEVKISLDELKKHGLKTVQGSSKVNEQLSKYLDECDKSDREAARFLGQIPSDIPHDHWSLKSVEPIKHYSWMVYPNENNVVYKYCDKSFFEHSGSGLPVELRYFFNADKLRNGEKIEYEFYFKNKCYSAHAIMENNVMSRTRIFWSRELGKLFKEKRKEYFNYPIVRFQKLNDEDVVEFKIKSTGKQVFLVSLLSNDNENSIDYANEAIQDNVLVNQLKNEDFEDVKQPFKHNLKPKKKEKSFIINKNKTYPRDRKVSINALSYAEYKCEIDNTHLTFIRRNSNKPYTEPHHLVPMAYSDRFNVSLDVEENIVSLCSNCHNEIHYGRDADKLIKQLYEERKELLKKVGIKIDLEELLEMY